MWVVLAESQCAMEWLSKKKKKSAMEWFAIYVINVLKPSFSLLILFRLMISPII